MGSDWEGTGSDWGPKPGLYEIRHFDLYIRLL